MRNRKNNIAVNAEDVISIYCDLHNLLMQIDPTNFEQKILNKDAKKEINKRLSFTKNKLINLLDEALHIKTNLSAEQNIFKADYHEIIKKLLGS